MNKIIYKGVVLSSNDASTGTVCPKCFKPYYTLYPPTTDGGTCSCKPEPPKQIGWQCPACGCGNAPWAAKCWHCWVRTKGVE